MQKFRFAWPLLSLILASPAFAQETASNTFAVASATPIPTPTLTVADVVVKEGKQAVFTLKLSKATTEPVSIDFAFANGTAKYQQDFQLQQVKGSIGILPGEISATIPIYILDDSFAENDETLFLKITRVKGATRGTSVATTTILDNDVAQLSLNNQLYSSPVSQADVVEGNAGTRNVVFNVYAPGAQKTISLSYATQDGTAKAGSDYSAASGNLIIAPGKRASFSVAVAGDTAVEADENFTVNLTSQSAKISGGKLTGVIFDDDNPQQPTGRIAYDSDNRIYTIKPDGSGKRALTDGKSEDYAPLFSPDGSKIAFLRGQGAQDAVDLYVIDYDGKNLKRLTHTTNDGVYFSWSPDSSKLAFSKDVGTGDSAHSEIFVVGADGKGSVRLTDSAENVDNYGPQFTVAGSQIVFATVLNSDNESSDISRLVISNLDGSKQATIDTIPFLSGFGLSPDGIHLAFSQSNSDSENENYKIGTMALNGRETTILATGLSTGGLLQFSSDGKQIFFAASTKNSGISDLYSLGVSNSKIRRLTSNREVYGFSFSPDGKYIATDSYSGNEEIGVLKSGGGYVRSIIGDGEYPSWGPDFTAKAAADVTSSSSANEF